MRCREKEGSAGKRKGGRKRGEGNGGAGIGKGGWEGDASAGKGVQKRKGEGSAAVLREFMGRGAGKEAGAAKGGSQVPPPSPPHPRGSSKGISM